MRTFRYSLRPCEHYLQQPSISSCKWSSRGPVLTTQVTHVSTVTQNADNTDPDPKTSTATHAVNQKSAAQPRKTSQTRGHIPEFSPRTSNPPDKANAVSAATSKSPKRPSQEVDPEADLSTLVQAYKRRGPTIYAKPKLQQPGILSETHINWFQGRGISKEVLERNLISTESNVYCPAKSGPVEEVIAFPYLRRGEVLNIKYRHVPKTFWQVKGAEKIVFGYDDAIKARDVIIVEGEMDKLSLNEAGIWNVVSVPDGAPARVQPEPGASSTSRKLEYDPERDVKFSYVWQCRELWRNKTKIVLATDNDGPGRALAEELARRLGRERCWRVKWPSKRDPSEGGAKVEVLAPEGSNGHSPMQVEDAIVGPSSSAAELGGEPGDDGFRKDANEVLMKDGVVKLKELISNAEELPVAGLYRFREYYEDVLQYYNQDDPTELGVSTGWQALDPLYKVVPGELTIVTGIPNSGKSEWLDALLTNLAQDEEWCFALCSMEKKPRDHAKHLIEKFIRKPFFENIFEQRQRMSRDEVMNGLAWVDNHFHVIKYVDEDSSPTIDWILETARLAVMRFGIRGLVIDPYNEVDHARPTYMNETEYVSHMLSKVKRFAQVYGVHVWFVAHPRQMHGWSGQAPNLYDISGSAHFINKADNGIIVHRVWEREKEDLHQPRAGPGRPRASMPVKNSLRSNEVQILVRKVRNKAAGRTGDAVLVYDRPTGRYMDQGEVVDIDMGTQQPSSSSVTRAASSTSTSHGISRQGALTSYSTDTKPQYGSSPTEDGSSSQQSAEYVMQALMEDPGAKWTDEEREQHAKKSFVRRHDEDTFPRFKESNGEQEGWTKETQIGS
ncbi:hypothetical protein CEUSTIGMA_g2244.t1 [Chlamydomonas eustigma]|uniref:SF4 helicase domain-containing protein n=1 Tax=Chlamydomonas eustigma TaxID=1157962 RepID=A0A250WVD6_9CHLO|nr:hypothetical protein CEUSTIGMA_g2244.t1 [Chlamydomonas eustigma]|eukprot:GAX74797.1 hypothetical protein CEUSTIGMA_g2244.t1 [Chlamydomonas eustigma]